MFFTTMSVIIIQKVSGCDKCPAAGINYLPIYGTETITYRGPEIWKHVPQSIKDITSLAKFKQEIKCWRPAGCTCRLCKIFVLCLGFL